MKNVGFKLTNLDKKIGTNFVSESRGLTKKQLEDKLLELSKYREQIEEAQKDDPDIQEMKEELKELNRPYNESKKANAMKAKAIYLIMLEKYEDLDTTSLNVDGDFVGKLSRESVSVGNYDDDGVEIDDLL